MDGVRDDITTRLALYSSSSHLSKKRNISQQTFPRREKQLFLVSTFTEVHCSSRNVSITSLQRLSLFLCISPALYPPAHSLVMQSPPLTQLLQTEHLQQSPRHESNLCTHIHVFLELISLYLMQLSLGPAPVSPMALALPSGRLPVSCRGRF